MIFGCRVVLPLPADANVRQMGSSVCLCADDMCLCSSAVFFLIYTFGWQVDCDITFPHTIKHQRAIIYKTMESRVLGKRNSMYKCGLLVEIVDVDWIESVESLKYCLLYVLEYKLLIQIITMKYLFNVWQTGRLGVGAVNEEGRWWWLAMSLRKCWRWISFTF